MGMHLCIYCTDFSNCNNRMSPILGRDTTVGRDLVLQTGDLAFGELVHAAVVLK
jgi:hypothetical protein